MGVKSFIQSTNKQTENTNYKEIKRFPWQPKVKLSMVSEHIVNRFGV